MEEELHGELLEFMSPESPPLLPRRPPVPEVPPQRLPANPALPLAIRASLVESAVLDNVVAAPSSLPP